MGRRNKTYHRSLKEQAYDRLTGRLLDGIGMSKKEVMEADRVNEERHKNFMAKIKDYMASLSEEQRKNLEKMASHARADGSARDKIFSYSTYNTYRRHCRYYLDWLQQKHPDCTTLSKARKYVPEWLRERMASVDKHGKHLSAWTINLERQAVCKLFDIAPDDPKFFKDVPKRKRSNITRSRGEKVRDKHFSEQNHWDLVCFCRGTGSRRAALAKLEGRDLWTKDAIENRIAELEAKPESERTPEEKADLWALHDAMQTFSDHDYFIHYRTDKGGKSRYAPIIGPNKAMIVARMQATAPHDKVWQYVPGGADIHGYRGEYATAIYKAYARPIDQIPYDKVSVGGKYGSFRYQGDVYRCRADERGKCLDRAAMLKASKALGHNRISVVADNYIRGL